MRNETYGAKLLNQFWSGFQRLFEVLIILCVLKYFGLLQLLV